VENVSIFHGHGAFLRADNKMRVNARMASSRILFSIDEEINMRQLYKQSIRGGAPDSAMDFQADICMAKNRQRNITTEQAEYRAPR